METATTPTTEHDHGRHDALANATGSLNADFGRLRTYLNGCVLGQAERFEPIANVPHRHSIIGLHRFRLPQSAPVRSPTQC